LVHDSVVANHLYYIAREAISNAVRHGEAGRIDIELAKQDGRVVLRVTDDGVGLPADVEGSRGMGLRIMRYRARTVGGTLRVGPGARGGAVVECKLPIGQARGSEEGGE
ncbi:MAG: sensor histidine kinase, partial [Planctomycetota bacterium]